jgi:hypothetical protein
MRESRSWPFEKNRRKDALQKFFVNVYHHETCSCVKNFVAS